MNKHVDKQLRMSRYTSILDNGLRVELLPMPGYHKTYAVMSADVGSVDTDFTLSDGSQVHLPAGTSHYLEHKLFEKKDHDAFDLFGKLGADSNAFTDFTRTAYLFSTTSKLHQCLDVLLDFVQDPYFTPALVNKERGIIASEIRMYQDQPSERLYMGMMGNLYPNDPMHNDIAGTVRSIQQITADDLYQLYDAFYQPANMSLLVVGKLDPEQTMEWISDNQSRKEFRPGYQRPSSLKIADPSGHDVIASGQVKMPVHRSSVMVGLRGVQQFENGRERLKYRLSAELLLALLFDENSDNFLKLYNQGIIDDTFGYQFEMQRGFHFACFSTSTDKDDQFIDSVRQILDQADKELISSRQQFNMIKRAWLGRLIGLLDSPETVAERFAGKLYDNALLTDEIACLKGISIDDLSSVINQLIKPGHLTTYKVLRQN
ncbi:M16 family metallopeptidase [Limosilactobacillus sp.]|uniref:EF-P 5-aminopentanol modification-associated protein YfmH n=1 Tax=Limosilactobacillus sp. TaxID=2773925 RepID=UPI00345E3F6E